MMDSMRRISLLLAALVLAAPARAYQREDHYYSVRLALGAIEPRLPGDEIAAMCAQLADEAPELNPIAVYRRMMRHPFAYASWSLRSRGSDATVGRMVTVQQLLHGLTGGSSAAAKEIATATAREALAAARRAPPERRADALCALGFSLHFYGDAHAHRRLHNPAKMYPTGLGHMFDGSTPDLPLFTPARAKLWREYITSLKTLFPELAGSRLELFFDQCEECLKRARDTNAYASEDLRRLEAQHLERLGVAALLLPRGAPKLGSQRLVDERMAGAASVPNCERAWALYRTEAERAFAAYDADPAHDGAPSRTVRLPFYDGPIFDGGAR
jgi:hypothetical protein